MYQEDNVDNSDAQNTYDLKNREAIDWLKGPYQMARNRLSLLQSLEQSGVHVSDLRMFAPGDLNPIVSKGGGDRQYLQITSFLKFRKPTMEAMMSMQAEGSDEKGPFVILVDPKFEYPDSTKTMDLKHTRIIRLRPEQAEQINEALRTGPVEDPDILD